jgi:CRISPR-associated endonuclease/helicase Cas3
MMKEVIWMYISRIAKDGREQQTKQHLYESAEYAYHIGKKFMVPEICSMSTLFHDVGKLTSEFVVYLRNSHISETLGKKDIRRGSVIHSTQGAKYLYKTQTDDRDFIAALVREISAICIAGHHGGLTDGITPSGEIPLREKLEKENDDLHYSEAIKVAEEYGISANIMSGSFRRCVDELEAFIKKCKENELNVAFMLHLLTKSIFSSLVDSDRHNAYCFEIKKSPAVSPQLPPWDKYAQSLEQRISTFSADTDINMIRKDISEKCLNAANRPKGIYRLDVPTGGGKTLSSLRFALAHAKIHKAEHIIYVIPYLSVLEQTANDIKKALQFDSDDNFILEHHSNRVVSEDPGEAQAFRLLTDRWDSHIIITTMVQFLESIYSNRSSDLRKFHNMANAVFIFDEVQSLPIKCTFLFNEAINYLHYCAGCSILLCTATQPPLYEVEKPIKSKATSLIPDVRESFQKLKRTSIKDSTIPGGYTTDSLQRFILDRFGEEGNCLVILNTKKDAFKLYKSFECYFNGNPQGQIELIHLSTAMCPAHRLDTINAIKKKKQKDVLCISTQLIEAGVDISFGCVIRAIAGMDSIAQAAGRCNRNGEYPEGKDVYIVNLAEENLSKLPDIKCGADITYRLIANNPSDLLSPEIMERYYKEYFNRQKAQMYYPIGESINLYDLLSINNKGTLACRNTGVAKLPALRQAFQTAGEKFSVIDQRTISVIVPYADAKELLENYRYANIQERSALLRQFGRYSVSLYHHEVEKLNDLRAVTEIDDGILALDAGYYDKKLGVIFERKLELLGVWG